VVTQSVEEEEKDEKKTAVQKVRLLDLGATEQPLEQQMPRTEKKEIIFLRLWI